MLCEVQRKPILSQPQRRNKFIQVVQNFICCVRYRLQLEIRQRCYRKNLKLLLNRKHIFRPTPLSRTMLLLRIWPAGKAGLFVFPSVTKIIASRYTESCLRPVFGSLLLEMDSWKIIGHQDFTAAHRAKKTDNCIEESSASFFMPVVTSHNSSDFGPSGYGCRAP